MKNTIKILLCLAIISVFAIGLVGVAGASPERGKVVVAPIEMRQLELISVNPTAVTEKDRKSPYYLITGTSPAVPDIRRKAIGFGVDIPGMAGANRTTRRYEDRAFPEARQCGVCDINSKRNVAGSFYAYPANDAYYHANKCAIFQNNVKEEIWAEGAQEMKRPGQMYWDREKFIKGNDPVRKLPY